jgi:L-fuculose-phosphate aldolase
MDTILNTALMHPADQIALIIRRIYQRGMTTTSGGNLSIIDDNGDIWITPAGVDKGTLNPSDIVCVKPQGSVVGKHKPSSEYPFHKAIYEIRPDIRAVIHAHPPALVAFSIVHQIPDTGILYQARHVCGSIGYAAYELTGSNELGKRIAAEFKKGFKAIIMENHGTVVGGSDLADAFMRFEALEYCAATLLSGKAIGEPKHLTESRIAESDVRKAPLFPEMKRADHPSDEIQKRTEICEIVHRACNQGLMIGAFGTVSLRWQGNDFLITPSGLSRWDLQTDDMVQIKEGMCEPGKTPSRAAWLHHEIYRRHPGINAIIQTQSPYLMAFGVTHTLLNVRTIPESWIFLQDVPMLPFEVGAYGCNDIPETLSEDVPVVIIENNSVVVTGDRLLQTFDRLEVAEFSAKSLVLARPIGNLFPITDHQVEDMRRAFFKK